MCCHFLSTFVNVFLFSFVSCVFLIPAFLLISSKKEERTTTSPKRWRTMHRHTKEEDDTQHHPKGRVWERRTPSSSPREVGRNWQQHYSKGGGTNHHSTVYLVFAFENDWFPKRTEEGNTVHKEGGQISTAQGGDAAPCQQGKANAAPQKQHRKK